MQTRVRKNLRQTQWHLTVLIVQQKQLAVNLTVAVMIWQLRQHSEWEQINSSLLSLHFTFLSTFYLLFFFRVAFHFQTKIITCTFQIVPVVVTTQKQLQFHLICRTYSHAVDKTKKSRYIHNWQRGLLISNWQWIEKSSVRELSFSSIPGPFSWIEWTEKSLKRAPL